MKNDLPSIPIAPKKEYFHIYHGKPYEDLYAWLKDQNWQEVMKDPSKLDSEIAAYLIAENKYSEFVLGQTKSLKSKIFEEMKGRTSRDDISVPKRDGRFSYFEKYMGDEQYPIFCRSGPDGKGRVILDANLEAKGKKFFRLAEVKHSPNHKLIAYAFDDIGSENFTICIRDLDSGEDLANVILGSSGNFHWFNDSSSLLYSALDESYRPFIVRRHILNTKQETDQEVYRESDPGFFVSLSKTENRKCILIKSNDHQTSEVRFMLADKASQPPVLIAGRVPGCQYEVSHNGDKFYILTNADGAEDFKIVSVSENAPAMENWETLISHKQGVLIQELHLFEKFWVRIQLVHGLRKIIVSRYQRDITYEIKFDEPLYDVNIEKGLEFSSLELRVSYSSLAKPKSIFDYDIVTRKKKLRKEQQIPSGHNPKDYKTERVYAPAKDGELVPISLIYKATTPIDGTAPLMLYGYGSYGVVLPPNFSIDRLSLVDRGFVFGVAHIRGGEEKGKSWYKSGRREFKKNTFSDYEDATSYLIQKGYSAKGLVVAHGGSAGGMLVGACVNMNPGLYGAVIAEVPFVDVLNTMSDPDLPLTPIEWPEWGNPIREKKDFEYIKSYSPYNQVSRQKYPAIFVTAGLTDPRVGYWEPAKWVAKLRDLKTDNNLLILRTNMEAGHGGASGRFDRIKERAEVYAFAIDVIGKKLKAIS
uniref:Protease II n=1 Tax=uncultured nuHF1 cluster bacterium HF0770_35I22 TaxID=723586 RepID=E7C7N3_9BACT|nr:protease II [uncultured nuHF1 cluster bacterium HF0770_35I22]